MITIVSLQVTSPIKLQLVDNQPNQNVESTVWMTVENIINVPQKQSDATWEGGKTIEKLEWNEQGTPRQ